MRAFQSDDKVENELDLLQNRLDDMVYEFYMDLIM